MKARWRGVLCLFLCGILGWFLVASAAIRASMVEALALCVQTVIPALFPFLVVSTLLLSLGFGELAAERLSCWMVPLFRIGGAGSAALALGAIGGYPIGARTAGELYQSGQLTREEAERLLAFCNNSNPAFLISVLGVGVFHSFRVGVWLWLIHLCSALLTGLLFRGSPNRGRSQTVPPARPVPVSFPAAFVSAVRASLSGMLSVCAFVVFFYVLARPLTLPGGWLSPLLVGALELFSLTPLLPATPFGFVLAAGAAGWGGLSVLAQTAAVLSESTLSLRNCFLGKAIQCGFSVLLALALSGYVLP